MGNHKHSCEGNVNWLIPFSLLLDILISSSVSIYGWKISQNWNLILSKLHTGLALGIHAFGRYVTNLMIWGRGRGRGRGKTSVQEKFQMYKQAGRLEPPVRRLTLSAPNEMTLYQVVYTTFFSAGGWKGVKLVYKKMYCFFFFGGGGDKLVDIFLGGPYFFTIKDQCTLQTTMLCTGIYGEPPNLTLVNHLWKIWALNSVPLFWKLWSCPCPSAPSIMKNPFLNSTPQEIVNGIWNCENICPQLVYRYSTI